ncbi:MAG: hypothetical protein ABIX01_10505 [Chitinophagaceae bacterium]
MPSRKKSCLIRVKGLKSNRNYSGKFTKAMYDFDERIVLTDLEMLDKKMHPAINEKPGARMNASVKLAYLF